MILNLATSYAVHSLMTTKRLYGQIYKNSRNSD